MPERAGLDQLEFVFAIAEQFAQPRIVKQQAPRLVDDQKRRRTELQHLVELAFLLLGLRAEHASAVRRRTLARRRVK